MSIRASALLPHPKFVPNDMRFIIPFMQRDIKCKSRYFSFDLKFNNLDLNDERRIGQL